MLKRRILTAAHRIFTQVRYTSNSSTPKQAPKKASRNRANPTERKLDSQSAVEEFLDASTGAGSTKTGRSWRTSELRLKSFEDLHRLWYVLLKERNVLMTEKAWCKTNGRHWVHGASNLYKVKRSMARLKGVVGERERALRRKLLVQAMDAEREGRGLGDVLETGDGGAGGVVTRTSPSL